MAHFENVGVFDTCGWNGVPTLQRASRTDFVLRATTELDLLVEAYSAQSNWGHCKNDVELFQVDGTLVSAKEVTYITVKFL